MNTNTTSGPELAYKMEFDPEKFANRQTEIELLAARISQAKIGVNVQQPLVNLWGISGIGKTWLLNYAEYIYSCDLSDVIPGEKPVCAIYFDFERRADWEVMAVLRELAERFQSKLPESLSTGQSWVEIAKDGHVELFVNTLRQLAKKVVPVLLFDTTEKLPAEFWTSFEQDVLEPLLITNQIVVVIAGRRRAPRWRRVEVRRRAAPSADCQVEAFKQADIQKQLSKIDMIVSVELAEQLFALSGGNPQLIHQVGGFLRRQTERTPESADVVTYQEQLKEILIAYKTNVLSDIEEAKEQKFEQLEALSVLRFYRTEALRYMLQVNQLKPNQPADVQLLFILRQLDETTEIVWWEDSKNGYITAPVLRKVMNQLWRLEDENLFITRHQQALDLYWYWVEQYPENRPIYLVEICYHQASIDRIKHPDAASLTDLARIIAFAERLEMDKFVILSNRLQQDRELQQILPTGLFQELTTKIEQMQKQEALVAA